MENYRSRSHSPMIFAEYEREITTRLLRLYSPVTRNREAPQRTDLVRKVTSISHIVEGIYC